jgi:hypothetical protein
MADSHTLQRILIAIIPAAAASNALDKAKWMILLGTPTLAVNDTDVAYGLTDRYVEYGDFGGVLWPGIVFILANVCICLIWWHGFGARNGAPRPTWLKRTTCLYYMSLMAMIVPYIFPGPAMFAIAVSIIAACGLLLVFNVLVKDCFIVYDRSAAVRPATQDNPRPADPGAIKMMATTFYCFVRRWAAQQDCWLVSPLFSLGIRWH